MHLLQRPGWVSADGQDFGEGVACLSSPTHIHPIWKPLPELKYKNWNFNFLIKKKKEIQIAESLIKNKECWEQTKALFI